MAAPSYAQLLASSEAELDGLEWGVVEWGLGSVEQEGSLVEEGEPQQGEG